MTDRMGERGRQGAAPLGPEATGGRLWAGLAGQQAYYEHPLRVDPGDVVWLIRTKPGLIFDDYFWDVFHALRLHVCHVAYYGLERLEATSAPEGVFELRFKATDVTSTPHLADRRES